MSVNENFSPTYDSFTRDNLFASGSGFPIAVDYLTIASGASLTRGTVLGIITASGKAAKVNSANTDGSQTAYAILCQDTDASAADVVAPVYLTGEFNGNSLVFGGTDTTATHKAALRKIGIFIKSALPK
jgi:hypothetical protein